MKKISQIEYQMSENDIKILESRGNELATAFYDLNNLLDTLPNGSKSITPELIAEMKAEVDALQKSFAEKLKGKGLIGW